jgi:hypothetical protein
MFSGFENMPLIINKYLPISLKMVMRKNYEMLPMAHACIWQ